ncbi:trafficking protein particle complex subunit 10-like [Schistocerca gregaria]|uniref:trafficking protein particle complex subunit 10-like n=1 Tax=Schistocerca gregaria TaxID=7010 RepID=UPI00211E9668|nr:trafficking protein particle complex subunit 10-like [Schistocerca gregaria]
MTKVKSSKRFVAISFNDQIDGWKHLNSELKNYLPLEIQLDFVKTRCCFDINFVPESSFDRRIFCYPILNPRNNFSNAEASSLPKMMSPTDLYLLANSHQKPFLKIFFTTGLQYQRVTRPNVLKWMNTMVAEGDEWLIIHFEFREAGFFQIKNPGLSLKRDFNRDKVDRVCIFKAFEINKQNAFTEIVEKIKEGVIRYGNRIIEMNRKYINVMEFLRLTPEFDYLKFFAVKENLAFIYEALNCYNLTLSQYDELETLFQLGGLEKWVTVFRKHEFENQQLESLSVLDYKNMSYTQAFLDHTITEYEFLQYLFSRQVHFLFLLNDIVHIARRGIRFVARFESLQASQQSFLFRTIWSYFTLIDISQACKTKDIPQNQVSDITYLLGRIYHMILNKLEHLGRAFGILPSSHLSIMEECMNRSTHLTNEEKEGGLDVMESRLEDVQQRLSGPGEEKQADEQIREEGSNWNQESEQSTAQDDCHMKITLEEGKDERNVAQKVKETVIVKDREGVSKRLVARGGERENEVNSILMTKKRWRDLKDLLDNYENGLKKWAVVPGWNGEGPSPLEVLVRKWRLNSGQLIKLTLIFGRLFKNYQSYQLWLEVNGGQTRLRDFLKNWLARSENRVLLASVFKLSKPQQKTIRNNTTNLGYVRALISRRNVIGAHRGSDFEWIHWLAICSLSELARKIPFLRKSLATVEILGNARQDAERENLKEEFFGHKKKHSLRCSLEELKDFKNFDQVYRRFAMKAAKYYKKQRMTRHFMCIEYLLGNYCFSIGRYEEALRYFKGIVDGYRKEDWDKILFVIYNKMSACYRQIGRMSDYMITLKYLVSEAFSSHATREQQLFYEAEFLKAVRSENYLKTEVIGVLDYDKYCDLFKVKLSLKTQRHVIDNPVSIQIAVMNPFSSPITLDALHVYFSTGTAPVYPKQVCFSLFSCELSSRNNKFTVEKYIPKGLWMHTKTVLVIGNFIVTLVFLETLANFQTTETPSRASFSAVSPKFRHKPPVCSSNRTNFFVRLRKNFYTLEVCQLTKFLTDAVQPIKILLRTHQDTMQSPSILIFLDGKAVELPSKMLEAEKLTQSSLDNHQVSGTGRDHSLPATTFFAVVDGQTVILPDINLMESITLSVPINISPLPIQISSHSSGDSPSLVKNTIKLVLHYKNHLGKKVTKTYSSCLSWTLPISVSHQIIHIDPLQPLFLKVSLHNITDHCISLLSYSFDAHGDVAIIEDLNSKHGSRITELKKNTSANILLYLKLTTTDEDESQKSLANSKKKPFICFSTTILPKIPSDLPTPTPFHSKYNMPILIEPFYYSILSFHQNTVTVGEPTTVKFLIRSLRPRSPADSNDISLFYRAQFDAKKCLIIGKVYGKLDITRESIVQLSFLPLKPGLYFPALTLEEHIQSHNSASEPSIHTVHQKNVIQHYKAMEVYPTPCIVFPCDNLDN